MSNSKISLKLRVDFPPLQTLGNKYRVLRLQARILMHFGFQGQSGLG